MYCVERNGKVVDVGECCVILLFMWINLRRYFGGILIWVKYFVRGGGNVLIIIFLI